jgi:NTP pyrophosphatase (non-canonical NTP hydrolase)
MRADLYKKGVIAHESNDFEAIGSRINDSMIRVLHASLGLTTETGELVDQVKKHLFYGKELDVVNIKEELGDTLWYVNILLDVFGWTIEEIMQTNHEKLAKRYGNSFSEERANVRDLDKEREILENGSGS